MGNIVTASMSQEVIVLDYSDDKNNTKLLPAIEVKLGTDGKN